MARTGRPPRRRDAKNRVLRRGESLREDGRQERDIRIIVLKEIVYR